MKTKTFEKRITPTNKVVIQSIELNPHEMANSNHSMIIRMLIALIIWWTRNRLFQLEKLNSIFKESYRRFTPKCIHSTFRIDSIHLKNKNSAPSMICITYLHIFESVYRRQWKYENNFNIFVHCIVKFISLVYLLSD